jgi:hypothetical protein
VAITGLPDPNDVHAVAMLTEHALIFPSASKWIPVKHWVEQQIASEARGRRQTELWVDDTAPFAVGPDAESYPVAAAVGHEAQAASPGSGVDLHEQLLKERLVRPSKWPFPLVELV